MSFRTADRTMEDRRIIALLRDFGTALENEMPQEVGIGGTLHVQTRPWMTILEEVLIDYNKDDMLLRRSMTKVKNYHGWNTDNDITGHFYRNGSKGMAETVRRVATSLEDQLLKSKNERIVEARKWMNQRPKSWQARARKELEDYQDHMRGLETAEMNAAEVTEELKENFVGALMNYQESVINATITYIEEHEE